MRLRLVLLVVMTIIVQGGIFPHVRLFGVVPDLGLLVAIAVAFRLGSGAGAVVGFATGLGFDLLLETPVGLCALAWSLTAWGVGAFHTGLVHPPRLLSPILGAAAGLVAGLLFVALGIIFGVEELRDWEVLGVILRVSLFDALLAPFVFLLVGKVLTDEGRVPEGVW
jgi:rod shape-determining protein MreD